MNKQQFLGVSLHTGLKVKYITDRIKPYSSVKYEAEFECGRYIPIESTPILRPLSDLIKPITHNGETFVPLVELAKIADMNVTDDFKCVEHHNAWGARFKDEDDEGVFYEILSYSSNTNSFSTQTIQCEDIISERVLEMTFNQLQLFQKLIEWHFNLMDESEPFIPVTEEFNPYK